MAEISARDSNVVSIGTARRQRTSTAGAVKMTSAQRAWLGRGMTQPGGKLPLFDGSGQRISEAYRQKLYSAWLGRAVVR